MKYTIQTKALLAALATLKQITKPNTTHAILGNVCITAGKDHIVLLGMDLEKQLSVTLPCKVKEQGETTLPINRLHDSIDKMKAMDCTFESNSKHEATIRAGSAVMRLLGLGVEDMPPQIEVGESDGVTMPAIQFNTLMGNALLHASDDPALAIMNSATLLSRNGMLNIQAATRKHAIICNSELEFKLKGKFIVPSASIPAMTKIATEGNVELLFGNGAMSIKTETMEFRTKLLDGNIPDFEQAFPKERPLSIIVNRQELNDIVAYAEVQTSQQSTHIILSCDGASLSARGSSVASAGENEFMDMNEDKTVCKEGSATIEVKVNPDSLRIALKCMIGDDVTLEMVDNKMPIVIQEGGIRCSICPMKLS